MTAWNSGAKNCRTAFSQFGTGRYRGPDHSYMNNSEYRKVVDAAMATSLRGAGFRWRRGLYERSVDGVVHLVASQSSSTSTAATLKITVNLGVWLSVLSPNESPDVWSAHWRERLGRLMPEREDVWWMISTLQEAESAASAIVLALETYALPAFASLSTPQAFLELWRTGVSPGLTTVQASRYRERLDRGLTGG